MGNDDYQFLARINKLSQGQKMLHLYVNMLLSSHPHQTFGHQCKPYTTTYTSFSHLMVFKKLIIIQVTPELFFKCSVLLKCEY